MRFSFSQGLPVWIVAVVALFIWLGQSSLHAPEPAPGTGFSAETARTVLAGLLKENVPHPAGSPENAVIRDRIVAILTAAGYQPAIQSAFQCAGDGTPEGRRVPGCTQVENIVAVHRGTGAGDAILVTAHYDSVPAGPGASDDGAGVAVVLELARIMSKRKTVNDFVFLLSDGEETGLRGAVAFAEKHSLMKSIRTVMNIEARGASGPSMMFETGPGNAELVRLFSGTVSRPVSNSLVYEIYRLLPNDTDFSVYRRKGLTGFNFAYSNSASLYHSRRDDLANLDMRSLQHHGDNVVALASALENTDLGSLKSDTDASYFDVFGQFLVHWPASLNVPIALIALALLVAAAIRDRTELHLSSLAIATAAALLTPLLLFGLGWILSYPLGIWPGAHPLDHASPWSGRIATLAAALFASTFVSMILKKDSARAAFLVPWILVATGAVALALYLPGAAYLVLWPALVAALAIWIFPLRIAALAGFTSIAFFTVPYIALVELVLGFGQTHYKILVATLPCISLFSAWALVDSRNRLRSAALFASVAIGAALLAFHSPAYAVDHPRGTSLIYYQGDAPPPDWLVTTLGTPSDEFMHAASLPAEDTYFAIPGLSPIKARVKPAKDLGLKAPAFEPAAVIVDGPRSIMTGYLVPARAGYQIGVGIDPGAGVTSIRVGDPESEPAVVPPSPSHDILRAQSLDGPAPAQMRINGVGARRVPVEISWDNTKPGGIVLFERSVLPQGEEPDFLRRARTSDSAPVHAGDGALVVRQLDLNAIAREKGGSTSGLDQ